MRLTNVIEHELHLLLGAAQGKEAQQETECSRRRLGCTYRRRTKHC